MENTELPFGTLFEQIRRRNTRTVQAVAEKLGVTASTVRAWERGEYAPNTLGKGYIGKDLIAEALEIQDPAEAERLWKARPGGRKYPFGPPRDTIASLPVQPTGFIGRDRERGEVRALLLEARTWSALLVGPPGVGKTRLAIQVAEDMREDFPDGVAFADLAPLRDPELVLSTVAEALGILPRSGKDPASAMRAKLQGKQQLLILDNAEQVIEGVVRTLTTLSTVTTVKTLVTSRQAIPMRGMRRYPVAPLTLPPANATVPDDDLDDLPYNAEPPVSAKLLDDDLLNYAAPPRVIPADDVLFAAPPASAISPDDALLYDAVQLFVARAQDVQPDFEITPATAPRVVQICTRLDGLPLAIELVAARLGALALTDIETFVLNDQRLQAAGRGPYDVPARQHTLQATLDWSYGLLDESERRLFARLAVFVGGWTVDAAEVICQEKGEQPIHMLETLESLAEKSLVRWTENAEGVLRWTMLESIREYAGRVLEARAEYEQRMHAHCGYYHAINERWLAFMQASSEHVGRPEHEEWLRSVETWRDNIIAALGTEHDNIIAALRWALIHKNAPEIIALPSNFANLSWLMDDFDDDDFDDPE